MKKVLRRILILCILLVMTVTIGLIHAPSKTTHAATAYSNMGSTPVIDPSISRQQSIASGFMTPSDKDYQLENVTFKLSGNQRFAEARLELWDDNGGIPGSPIAFIEYKVVTGFVQIDVTFTPAAPITLTAGTPYYLVLTGEALAAAWATATPPSGIFTSLGSFWTASNPWRPFQYAWPQAPHLLINIEITDTGSGDGGSSIEPTTGNACEPDNRLNSVCLEPWQTAAIYCVNGDIHVYGIGENADGYLLFVTSPDEIDEVDIPDENTMLDLSLDGRIRLYRLPSGEFQLNSPIMDQVRGYLPNGYVFRWDEGCP